MKQKSSTKVALFVSGFFTIFIVMVALISCLSDWLKVEIKETKIPTITHISTTMEAKEQLFTVLYQQETDTKEITAIYIEVFYPSKETIYYMEVPVDTKIMLSNALYKSLQTYSPDLPQYLNLSKMAEGFSEEYAFTGCNRMLSELLGISFTHYISSTQDAVQQWFSLLEGETTKKEWFEQYSEWLEQSSSDLYRNERWMYYESYQYIKKIEKKMAIGAQEIGEFIISSKQCRELLEHWCYLLRTEK